MRGLMIGFVCALALYGLCMLALQGWDRFQLWWGVRRRRRSLRMAKRLLAPTPPPFPWLVLAALSCFITAMVVLGLSFEPAPAALPRLGEEIRIQQPRSAQVAMEATYYHQKYAGRSTASGDVYDPARLTAAHRTARLGEFMEITGPAGAAVVLINDRGPWCEHGPTCRRNCKRADIDLSEAAARAVGLLEPGRAIVQVRRRL